ncbi:hypothetical protein FGG08_006616 [Glutinoglossum americanum]|uniref:Uncharacterized protein n=1 Tax=Glutinoglossum americanum TaxID=1670608 RepID=A0A9P8HXY4_9PEZI|nr:hypothetical protein FGG08_006616 [Glutinoglossum americanum]
MSEQQPGEHSPVDTLSSMVNLVLVQAGKVFRDPTRRSLGNLVHTRSQVGVMVPAALESFHAALDELEIEILQAKEVFTRDLAVSRARLAQREREAADAAAAEMDRIAAEEASARAVENLEAENLDISMEKTGETDMAMTDQFTDFQRDRFGGSTAKEGTGVDAGETNERSIGQSKPPKPPPLNLSEATGSDIEHPGAEPNNLLTAVDTTVHSGSALNETPSTAGYKMDFESMFPNGDPGADDMNFDLNSFGGDGEQDFLGNRSIEGDGGNPTDTSGSQTVMAGSVDVSALLPGLETYANAEEDASMFGNPTADSATLPETTAVTTASAFQASASLSGEPTDLLPAESSFDDMFLLGDLGASDGAGDEDDGNFASEFDDLFFGGGGD